MSAFMSGPLSCEDVRRQLPLLIARSVDAERRGRLEGHIAVCAECAAALADRVAAGLVRGMIPVPDGVEVERAPSVLYPSAKALRSGKVGMMWQRGSSCRTLRADERRAMERARARLGQALEAGHPRTAIRTRGSAQRPGGWQTTIEVLSSSWETIAGAGIPCDLVAGPRISAEGQFSLRLKLHPRDFERCRGRTVICTVAFEDEKISFEAVITEPVIEITAEGLPQLGKHASLDRGWLRFCLMPVEE